MIRHLTLIIGSILSLLIAVLWYYDKVNEPVVVIAGAIIVVIGFFFDFVKDKSKYKQVNIKGKWDFKLAKKITIKTLQKANNEKTIRQNSHFMSSDSLIHEVIEAYDYDKFGDNDFSKVVVAYSRPQDEDGHVSSVSLNLLQFVHVYNGWALKDLHLGILQVGCFGMPPEGIHVFAIGYDILGVHIESGFTNQGITTTKTIIYANVLKELKCVLEYDSSYDDSGISGIAHNSWTATISPQKVGTGFYDLTVVKNGIENGNKISENYIYRYNGIRYVKSEMN